VVIGLVASAAATRVLERMLYGTSVHEADVYGVMAVGLVGVAALAAWVPGRRAAGADPMAVLRGE
jgi:putative ABC transport system permease protein